MTTNAQSDKTMIDQRFSDIIESAKTIYPDREGMRVLFDGLNTAYPTHYAKHDDEGFELFFNDIRQCVEDQSARYAKLETASDRQWEQFVKSYISRPAL